MDVEVGVSSSSPLNCSITGAAHQKVDAGAASKEKKKIACTIFGVVCSKLCSSCVYTSRLLLSIYI